MAVSVTSFLQCEDDYGVAHVCLTIAVIGYLIKRWCASYVDIVLRQFPQVARLHKAWRSDECQTLQAEAQTGAEPAEPLR